MPDLQQNNGSNPPIEIECTLSGSVVSGVTPTITIRQAGASAVSATGSVTASDSFGTAYYTPSSADVNTIGPLTINVSGTGIDSYALKGYRVVAFPPYTVLPAAAANASGGFITNGTGSGQISPDGSGNVSLSSAALTAIADAIEALTLAVDMTQIFGDSAAAEWLAQIMTGVAATGSITGDPNNGDTVTYNGNTFTLSTAGDVWSTLASQWNATANIGVTATENESSTGVNLVANQPGAAWNVAISTDAPSRITVSGMSGGSGGWAASSTQTTDSRMAAGTVQLAASQPNYAPATASQLPSAAPGTQGGLPILDDSLICTVAASPSPTTTVFASSNLTSGTNYANSLVVFKTGANQYAPARRIASVSGTTITLGTALPNAPASGDKFEVIGYVGT